MWRYLTGCILIVIGAYFYMIFPGMERKREIWKFRGTQWAHRGLHDKKSGIPENSMAAFREAIRANKGIELDVLFWSYSVFEDCRNDFSNTL